MTCKNRAKNCGGCPLLELPYADQLKQKEEKVRALLGRYGPVHPIRGMETPYHYRNKVISTFAAGQGGKLVSGIYAAGTHKVLPVERCLLEDEVLDTVLEAVRAAAAACRYQPFREDQGTGLLRHCLLRRGVATGQVMVVLVTAQPILPGAKNFVRALLAEAEKRQVPVTTVVQNYNPRRTSVVLGEQEKVLYGKGFILDELCGKTCTGNFVTDTIKRQCAVRSASLESEFENKTSQAAEEGTAAHAWCEHKLKKALRRRSKRPVSSYDSDEMQEHTDAYVDFVLEQLDLAKQNCKDPLVLIEQHVDFSEYVPDGYGTADCVIVSDDKLHIIDFKYGMGVLVRCDCK